MSIVKRKDNERYRVDVMFPINWGDPGVKSDDTLTTDMTLGCDPEFMLYDRKGGVVVSAHDIVPGTKEEPFWFKDALGSVQSDGTAVEIGIKPALTAEEFQANVITTLEHVAELVGPEFDLLFIDQHEFPATVWNALPPIAKEIGCSPDWSVHGGMLRVTPKRPARTVFQGGHIHVGFRSPDKVAKATPERVAIHAQENLMLAGALNIAFMPVVSGTVRNQYYGNSFRHKPYGFEFRSLNNGWLGKPQLLPELFHSTMRALNEKGAGDFVNDAAYCRAAGFVRS